MAAHVIGNDLQRFGLGCIAGGEGCEIVLRRLDGATVLGVESRA